MLTHGEVFDNGAFAFFMGQAAAIVIEHQAIELGKKFGFKDSMFWRLVGFVWTVTFVGATCQKWLGSTMEHGMWVHKRRPDW